MSSGLRITKPPQKQSTMLGEQTEASGLNFSYLSSLMTVKYACLECLQIASLSAAAAAAKSLQSCPTLCDPRDGSPLGSSVPGILQARTLEWVAISFSNA